MGKALDTIIRDIADKYGLTIPQVEHMIDSQFRFVNDQIESKEYKTVSVIYIGKFTPNGLHKAKEEGRYKHGRFIKTKGNSSGLVEPSNEQGSANSGATNEDL